MCGIDGEEGITQVWPAKGPPRGLGYLVTMIGHGILIQFQASLASFSPYFLLYDRDPDLPTTIRRESSEVVNLDDSKMCLKVCSQRAELFRRLMPATFDNLAIAQHRDTLWYATFRGGGYRPSIRRFHVGDYVYL
jgi:hypothetical protein